MLTPEQSIGSLARRLPVGTLALVAVCLGLFFVTEHSAATFNRLVASSLAAAPWQILSAHLVHTDWVHLTANLLALAVLGYALEQHSRCEFWLATLLGAVGVSIWFGLQSGTDYYCGMSGVLCAYAVVALIQLYQVIQSTSKGSAATVFVILAGALLVTKLGVEQWSDVRLLGGTTWPSAPGAHLAGACGGLVAIVFAPALPARQRQDQSYSSIGDRPIWADPQYRAKL